MTTRRLLSLLIALGALYPKLALACPVCAVDQNVKVMRIAAVFLAVPFLVSIIVVRAIVRAQQRDT